MGFKYISAYFRHRLKAKTRHGTHSPFVYKLADEVIYDFSSKKVYEEIEAQRKKLLNDDKTASKVGKRAKNDLRSPRLLQLVFRLVAYHQPKQLIEIGTGFGITTAYLAKACVNANVLALVDTAEVARLTKQNLATIGVNNTTLELGKLEETFKMAIAKTTTLDLVYIGGKNDKDFSLTAFNLCLTKANEHTVIIFDQIYWNEEMQSAWQTIKNHPQVSITIDLFWLGLVYFRKGQAKEHFKLKF
ncbi:O-methyltransferase [Pedobacter sp. Hv1]|uniref:O-methyltransferase n=1 Tax=Pedobacter sp. Hv1 TaxID=1740090 RepID=UPI0006D89F1D|nr:class I SAM-dependent methyltransferase [Pedobacter sp. Hv1]KQB99644.1 SAM-dependent methyltransferase [Pedobacter sp. Hv1]